MPRQAAGWFRDSETACNNDATEATACVSAHRAPWLVACMVILDAGNIARALCNRNCGSRMEIDGNATPMSDRHGQEPRFAVNVPPLALSSTGNNGDRLGAQVPRRLFLCSPLPRRIPANRARQPAPKSLAGVDTGEWPPQHLST